MPEGALGGELWVWLNEGLADPDAPEKVKRLNSEPSLGLEHAAYRIETGQGAYWIDCPSSFDASLQKTEAIFFTHHHFLGASNLYREMFGAEVRIHRDDSTHEICRPFTFDVTFEKNSVHNGIEAFHIDGHTPGFTFTSLKMCFSSVITSFWTVKG